jgi:hypothetical protein
VCGGGPSLIGGDAGQHTTPEAHGGLLQLEHSFGQARRYESNVQLTQGEVALVVSQKQAIKPLLAVAQDLCASRGRTESQKPR